MSGFPWNPQVAILGFGKFLCLTSLRVFRQAYDTDWRLLHEQMMAEDIDNIEVETEILGSESASEYGIGLHLGCMSYVGLDVSSHNTGKFNWLSDTVRVTTSSSLIT